MKVVAVFALLALCSGSATVTHDNTITKVVKLLQGMLDQSVTEGDEERKIFAKFKCYCDQNEAEKNTNIDNLKETISLLESKIEELQGSTGVLSSEVADLKAAMAENVAAREEATTLRNKENGAFVAEKADLEQAIDQMKRAIETLTAVGADQTSATGADNKQFMAGHKAASLVNVQSEVQHALRAASALMSPEQHSTATAFLQSPFTGTYTSQSAVVMGIIKSMRDTFEKNLEDAILTEGNSKKAYDKFTKIKEEGHEDMSDSYDAKQKVLGGNDGDLSTKKSQLSTAEKNLADDEEFLGKLVPMCKDKSEAYGNRKVLRANEESAIAEAISILNSDDAFATFGTTDATSTGGSSAGLRFTQLRSVSRHSASNVRRTVQNAVEEAHSDRLSKVVALVQGGNPFTEVLGEIAKMLEVITAEGKADATKLGWCNKERDTSVLSRDKKNREITGLDSEINRLTDLINNAKTGLKHDIAETEQSLVDNDKSQKDETVDRTSENLNYQKDVKNLVKAQSILAKAIKVLKTYYDDMEAKLDGGMNAFVQEATPEENYEEKLSRGMNAFVQEDPNAPAAMINNDAQYEGQSSKGNDIMKMLNFINDSTNAEEMKAHQDEDAAQATYEDSMTALKSSQATLEKNLGKLQEDLATAEQDLLEAKEDNKATTAERDALVDYLKKIKPGCDFITSNFGTREANRATEKNALTKAIRLIKATPAYKTAVNSATVESYGDCKAPCTDDKSGVECKACMADVTIPAYCAGHKGTRGC